MPVFGTVDTQTDLTGGGTLIINAARPPTDTDGVVGDYWLDTAGKTLYGPKGAGGYGATESAHPEGSKTFAGADGSTFFTLGAEVKLLVDGRITGVRFYRDAGVLVTGHTLKVYNTSGGILATVVTSGESGAGWVSGVFATPVVVTANTQVIVAYYTEVGGGYVFLNNTVPASTIPTHVTFLNNRRKASTAYPDIQVTPEFYVDILFQPTLTAWPIAIKSAP